MNTMRRYRLHCMTDPLKYLTPYYLECLFENFERKRRRFIWRPEVRLYTSTDIRQGLAEKCEQALDQWISWQTNQLNNMEA